MLRRLLIAAVLAFCVSVGLAQAAGPKDYAKGVGVVRGFGVEFSFNATSDPAGGDPKGTLTFKFPNLGVEGMFEVTCLRVVGNTAVIGGDQIKGNLPGDGIIFAVFDSGLPSGVFDQVVWAFVPDSPPEDACPVWGPGTELESGDITVIDE